MDKRNKIIKNILSYVLIIVIALLIKFFIFSPIRVNGTSMSPTLEDGDIMILNEIGYRIHGLERFDIAVAKVDDELLIKRVIGLPGDEVKYENNKLYINGKYIKEKFTRKKTADIDEVVPKGKYFVLGDNRPNSLDSEEFGAVSSKEILGKTKLALLPPRHFGNKK